jgi:hypothetical protein
LQEFCTVRNDVVETTRKFKANDEDLVHVSVYSNRIVARLERQRKKSSGGPVIPPKASTERITSALQIRIRDIDAELAALATQADADQWLVAELRVERKRLEFALEDLGAAP